MKLNFKLFAGVALAAIVLASCKKVKDNFTALGDGGKTVVKVVGGGDAPDWGFVFKGIDFVGTSQTVDALDIRRDASTTANLNKAMSVTIKDDTAAIRAYNTANGTNLVPLPRAWYSTNYTLSAIGGNYTIPFAAGDAAKQISITVPNAQLFDPATQYAVAFTIVSSTDPDALIGAGKTYIFGIGAKNPWDGVYKLTFSNYHPTANANYDGGVTEVHLITTGAVTCKIFWPDAGGFANPAILNGGLSYFGAQEPVYTFDPGTYKVTVQNGFSGATTFYTMNPGFNSYYDPATKTIYAKWGYSYVGGTFATGTSREWTQKFEYLRSR